MGDGVIFRGVSGLLLADLPRSQGYRSSDRGDPLCRGFDPKEDFPLSPGDSLERCDVDSLRSVYGSVHHAGIPYFYRGFGAVGYYPTGYFKKEQIKKEGFPMKRKAFFLFQASFLGAFIQ